jgi:drug/metabolite transporter (DMT)-like permease
MSPETARNIGVIVLLALVVWLVPGGGEGASFINQLLGAIFIVLMALGCAILYRRFRGEIFSLGDTWRFALYAAVGIAIVTVAASRRLFDTGAAGALLWFGLVGGASYTLYLVWQRHRSYS